MLSSLGAVLHPFRLIILKVTSEGCLTVSSAHFSSAKLLVGSLQIHRHSPVLDHTPRACSDLCEA